MKEWFIQYWYWVIVFFIVLAATIFGMYKASGAYKKHYELFRADEEKAKHLSHLKQKFVPLTENAIDTAESSELLEGVALSYQFMLQKQADMTAEFEKLPIEARYIYTLDIFVSEGAVPSGFFRNNGKELKNLIVPALKAVGDNEAARLVSRLVEMFDEDSEVSVDRELIAKTDAEFKEKFDAEKFRLKAAEYIRNNKSALV